MINDFSTGRVKQNIFRQAMPLFVAQLVSILYNVVDRIYIGHMPECGTMALTGIGLAFPLTTLISAFAALYATGGASLFAIARGAGEEDRAEKILAQTALLLGITSLFLFIFCYVFRKPVLFLFGASNAAYPFADTYLKIYLWGTVFTMFSTGMNPFINAQGYPGTGMLTVLIGAICNLILDPVFIYVLKLGVAGAAIATVISQCISFVWVLLFFFGKKTNYRFRIFNFRPDGSLIGNIYFLGISGFIALGTNCLVQIVVNKTLMVWGGDLFVSAMTVLYSVREILGLPVISIANGAQPVLGYNFGAGKYEKVKEGIRFEFITGLAYTIVAWALVFAFPSFWFRLFSSDAALIDIGTRALRIYFFGFCFMLFQMAGQSTYVALRCPKRATFFSLLRKIIIVVPLTMLLPGMGLGTDGVFLAEPISNIVGGLASFTTMYLTIYRKLGNEFVCKK